MYDRAKRNMNYMTIEDFGPFVGPGSYDLKSNPQICNIGGYAPFGSLEQRKTIFEIRDEIPPPWEYDPILVSKHLKGCSSLKNTEARFKTPKSIVPGPGAYEIKSGIQGCENDPCKLLMPCPRQCENPKFRIRRVKSTIPSIVTTLDAHGYEEGPNGQLVPRKVEMINYFEEENSFNSTSCDKYRGCIWSNRTGQRNMFCPKNDFPGPGRYLTVMNDEWIQLIIRGLQRNYINSNRILDVPRTMEMHIREAKREDIPGPGSYFKDKDTEPKVHPARPGFLMSSQRFPKIDVSGPSPGKYNVKGDKFFSHCNLKNCKSIPFLSTDRRLGYVESDDTPAPGTYESRGIADLLAKRLERRRAGPNVGFDSSAPRVTMTGRPRKKVPPPTEYNLLKPPNLSSCDVKGPTAAFKARAEESDKLANNDIPPPNRYYPEKGIRATRDHRSFHVSKGKDAFLTSDERFTKHNEGTTALLATPGPGTYCIARDPRPTHCRVLQTEERFKYKDNGIPGPANYKLHPAVDSSVLIKTFNITLMKRAQSAPEKMSRSKRK